jgi:isocitrate/isopropylmalate dehydrogenase
VDGSPFWLVTTSIVRAPGARDHPLAGSAGPDIAGQGIANPLGAIWCASMMLDHLGHPDAATEVFDSFAHVLATTSVRTRDLGRSRAA